MVHTQIVEKAHIWEPLEPVRAAQEPRVGSASPDLGSALFPLSLPRPSSFRYGIEEKDEGWPSRKPISFRSRNIDENLTRPTEVC
jgi:hypothetical protein